ncbi:MAG: hypothetical protein U5N56_04095 [Candidatus Marinimicrobia bacterium]|nr:hypothetical protein [Candidatus Neomarinimicrobiota bacterium]
MKIYLKKRRIPNRKYAHNSSIYLRMALHFTMLIVSALFIEAAPLITALGARRAEKYSKKAVLYRSAKHDILITGVGKMMAERSFRRYRQNNHADIMLNIGTAGILDPSISLCHVFEISGSCSEEHLQGEELFLIDGHYTAKCLTVNKPLTDAAERERLFQCSGARLADMECYHLARMAVRSGIRMSALKVTTDFADENTAARFPDTARPAIRKLTETCMDKMLRE